MAHKSHTAHHLMHHLPVEPTVAIVLSAAGVLTSWASYQAELWDGVQLMRYGRADGHRVEASSSALEASLTRAVEVSLFRAWIEAKSDGDDRLAGFYEARFPRNLGSAFSEWVALRPLENPKAPPSPFAMPSYRPQGSAQAASLEARAEADFRAAIEAKHTADAYVRGSLVLASAMFLGGICQVFKQAGARFALTLMSVLALLAGTVQIVRLPMLPLGH